MTSNLKKILNLYVLLMSHLLFAQAGAVSSCPAGEHWVRAHFRKSYIRADGVVASAAKVSAHCHPNPPTYKIWIGKFKSGIPSILKKSNETAKGWTDEERERVIEALGSLPDKLSSLPIGSIYRLSKSAEYSKNPAVSFESGIVLYDMAFASNQNLARILAHELAHILYSQTSGVDAHSYNVAAEWKLKTSPSGALIYVPMRKAYVESDGEDGPNEDFSNNIEYFLFKPGGLQSNSPKVYDWIRQRYGDSFRIKEGVRK